MLVFARACDLLTLLILTCWRMSEVAAVFFDSMKVIVHVYSEAFCSAAQNSAEQCVCGMFAAA